MNPFNKANALIAGNSCELAYLQASDHKAFLDGLAAQNFTLVDEYKSNIFSDQDYVGFLAAAADHMLLAFRGTHDAPDVLRDLELALVLFACTDNGGRVHQGFYEVYLSIRESLLANIGANDHLPLWIAAHSLGAALATMAVADVFGTLGLQPIFYSLGSPRVGDSQFVKSFDAVDECYRIANSCDLVTQLPFKIQGYCHVPQEVKVEFIEPTLVYGNHAIGNYITHIPDHVTE